MGWGSQIFFLRKQASFQMSASPEGHPVTDIPAAPFPNAGETGREGYREGRGFLLTQSTSESYRQHIPSAPPSYGTPARSRPNSVRQAAYRSERQSWVIL